MKNHLIYAILLLVPFTVTSQKQSALSKLLWGRVENCYANFSDLSEDEALDFVKIDDAKNGYLSISGTYPTCGCFCSSTIAAFKNKNGNYTLLQQDTNSCSWTKKLSATKPLKSILPNNFGLQDFSSEPITKVFDHPIFYLNFEIPRVGTTTKVSIEMLPFGLKIMGNELFCYQYSEQEAEKKSLFGIPEIVSKIKDENTLNFIVSGDFDAISASDSEIINTVIIQKYFQTKVEIQTSLIELKKIYTTYMSLTHSSIFLEWNKKESKFYIKEKGDKPLQISFKEFLLKNVYWGAVC